MHDRVTKNQLSKYTWWKRRINEKNKTRQKSRKRPRNRRKPTKGARNSLQFSTTTL